MAFLDIVSIEDYQFYLDVSFRRSNKQAAKIRGSKIKGTRLNKSWKVELARIETMKTILTNSFEKILKTYPSIDDLSEFYKELLKLHVDIKHVKKSLGAVNWAIRKIDFFYNIYNKKIKNCKQLDKVLLLNRLEKILLY